MTFSSLFTNFFGFISQKLPAILFGLIIVSFIIGIASILYHLIRFGIGVVTKVVAFLVFVAAFVALGFAIYFYSRLDLSFIGSLLQGNIFLQ